MGCKMPSVLSLLSLAAATPSLGDCPPNADSGQRLPRQFDLTGRPNIPPGLTAQTLKTPPGSEAGYGCRGPPRSVARALTLRSEAANTLHRLPPRDILQPIEEPKLTPQFQKCAQSFEDGYYTLSVPERLRRCGVVLKGAIPCGNYCSSR